MSVIEVNHFTKDYGFGRGVFDASFKVEKGEVFGFLGPNGAGKSTTIRHLMGFSKPQSGETKILGMDTFENYYKFLNKVGYIPGEIALPAGLTGWEFLRMMQSMQGIKNEEQLNKMLNLFELEDNVLKGETKRMSLGVKRKLAIVASFMSDPEVLILDEPTSGLDPVMQNVFGVFVKEEKKRGKTILLSSHIFSEVDDTCDRIAIIKDGKIVSQFVANDLKHASVKFYRVSFASLQDYNAFVNSNKQHVNLIEKNEQEKQVYISVDDKFINEAIAELSKYDIKFFENEKETLEDYFMKFYKEDAEFKGV